MLAARTSCCHAAPPIKCSAAPAQPSPTHLDHLRLEPLQLRLEPLPLLGSLLKLLLQISNLAAQITNLLLLLLLRRAPSLHIAATNAASTSATRSRHSPGHLDVHRRLHSPDSLLKLRPLRLHLKLTRLQHVVQI
jgi:hypothetical protein